MKTGKAHWIDGLIALWLLAGGILLAYPTAASSWNQHVQTEAMAMYKEMSAGLQEEEIAALLHEADVYNAALIGWDEDTARLSRKAYGEILAASPDGMMGTLIIDKIQLELPIYHGTSEDVLQKGIGHLESSSMPAGGLDTHCVLTGHTGLPSSRLFTDLYRLEVGDRFLLRIYSQVLYYEIDQIVTVLPWQTEELDIVRGRDDCTLVTCTPYGINSHRLLVRGRRIYPAGHSIGPSEVHLFSLSEKLPLAAGGILFLVMAGAWGIWKNRVDKEERIDKENGKEGSF